MFSKFINWMKPLPDQSLIGDKQQIAKKYKFWRIRMFLGMYVGYVMYYFTRKNLSYAAPSFINELGITKMEFGILGSTMYVAYGIGKFLTGVIADKCSIRSFMSIGLIGSSIINLFFGFLPSLPLLTFFWGINGGLQSMGFPPAAKAMVYWFSPSERATKWTLFSSTKTVGTSIIGVMAGICIATGHWKSTFYVPGIIGLLTGISMLFTLTDKPSSVGLPPIDIYHNDVLPVKKPSELSFWQTLVKYVYGNPYMWALAASCLFIYFIRYATLDWGALFMTEKGIAKDKAAYLLVFMPFVGVFGGILSGVIADKFFKGRCAPVNLIYLFCLIFSLWGMYHFTDPKTPWWIIGLFLALVGFFIEGPEGLVGGVQVSRVTVQESTAAANGFIGLFQYLGSFLSGVGTAYIIEKSGWRGVFIMCAISCVATMFFVSLTWKKEAASNKGKSA
jgi:sugar phosphate permease